MTLPVDHHLETEHPGDQTSGVRTLSASTVVVGAISDGTAIEDLRGTMGRETDIGMTEEAEGDQEAEIGHHAAIQEVTPEMTTEAESTVETTVTLVADMVKETTIDALIVMTTEEVVEDMIEIRITLASRMNEPTSDLGLEHPQETTDAIDLPRDLKSPTTGEIGPTKEAAILLLKRGSHLIKTSNPKTEILIKKELTLQLSKSPLLNQLIRPPNEDY